MQHQSNLVSRLLPGVSISTLALAIATALPVMAQDSANDEEMVLEEVRVTGFRSSLQQAVALKRDAVNSRDSIVTEDMGKMPDLNWQKLSSAYPALPLPAKAVKVGTRALPRFQTYPRSTIVDMIEA